MVFDFFNDMFCESKKCFFRYQVDSGNTIVLQGYKNILLVSPEKIVLKVQGGEVCISGKDLCIKEFCGGTIKVAGKIFSIENLCFGDAYAK
jgi:sporulation protein YqfC